MKPASRASASISAGVKKLINGVPLARSLRRSLDPGTHLVVSQFDRQQERHGELRTRGECRDLAQCGGDCAHGEVHADASGGYNRRLSGIKAGLRQPVPPSLSRLKIDWHKSQPLRNAEAELDQPLSLPGLRPGRSTSNKNRREAISGLRRAKVSSPAPRMTYCRARRTACSTTRSSMKRARATIEARTGVVNELMSGRLCQRSSGAANFSPTSSSSTCGGGSTATCSARHKATRSAVLSGAAICRSSFMNSRSDLIRTHRRNVSSRHTVNHRPNSATKSEKAPSRRVVPPCVPPLLRFAAPSIIAVFGGCPAKGTRQHSRRRDWKCQGLSYKTVPDCGSIATP